MRLDHGTAVANALARRMVVPPHRAGGKAQYVQAPVADVCAPGEPLAEVLDWAVANLDRPLSVEQLAARATMSPRTFARRFQEVAGTTPHQLAARATLSPRTFARRFQEVAGTTPHQWLLRQRVLHAQHLLETTDVPVERIATDVGFGSAAVLRQHFGRIVGTSPLAFRRTFEAEQAS